MLKFIIVPILGLLFTAGTYFYESPVEVPCAGLPAGISSDCKEDNRTRGFPLSLVEERGWLKDTSLEDQDSKTFQVQSTSIEADTAILNAGFWLVIVGIGYFVFSKIRNLVGTVVLVGIGVVAGLVYFGILVI